VNIQPQLSLPKEHAWLAVVAVQFVLGVVLDAAGVADLFRPELWEPYFIRELLGYLVVAWPFVLAAALLQRTPARAFDPRRVLRAVIACFGVVVLLKTHDGWKVAVGDAGFTWDTRLEVVDAWLHLGHAPWTLIPRLPTLTSALDYAYILWFGFFVAVFVWQAWSDDRVARARFFLAVALTVAMVGGGMAFLFRSAGPCYTEAVTGSTAFVPLMAYLNEVHSLTPLHALRGQALLWHVHANNLTHPWYSISAMPSMHVAYAVLWTCAGWQLHRALGGLLAVYAIAIQLGSVALGWHYAIDGYAGGIGAAGFWWLAGRVMGLARRAGGRELFPKAEQTWPRETSDR
jgi:hypothetical protein